MDVFICNSAATAEALAVAHRHSATFMPSTFNRHVGRTANIRAHRNFDVAYNAAFPTSRVFLSEKARDTVILNMMLSAGIAPEKTSLTLSRMKAEGILSQGVMEFTIVDNIMT